LAKKMEGNRVATMALGVQRAVASKNRAYVSTDTVLETLVVKLGLQKSAFILPDTAFPHLNGIAIQKKSPLKPVLDHK
jgi:hypothetical protein